MDTILQDLRYAARVLRRSPAFTVVVIATLALGIGANTAIFSVVNGVLLRALPYREPARIVRVFGASPGETRSTFSGPDYLDVRAQATSFEQLAAYVNMAVTRTGEGEAERFSGDAVTYNFFEVFGVKPLLGRTFISDGPRAQQRLVVLSHRYWRAHYNGARDVLARVLTLNDQPYTVVGVMPSGFESPTQADVWVLSLGDMPQSPFGSDQEFETKRDVGYLQLVGRLKDGVDIEAAQQELAGISNRLAVLHPAESGERTIRVLTLRDDLVHDSRNQMLLLLAAVGMVLLIACANIANLLLTRSAARQRELNVRIAIGASRARIVRQLATESVLLAVIGGGVGLLLAPYALGPLQMLIPPQFEHLDAVRIDSVVLTFTFLLSIVCGLMFGLMPALQVSSDDPARALREGGRGATRGSTALRSGLVATQVAISILLLIGAGLLIRSMSRMQRVDTGYERAGVLLVSLPLSPDMPSERQTAFYNQLTQNLRALPGVTAAGAVFPTPLSGGRASTEFSIEGRAVDPKNPLVAGIGWATPGFFSALGVRRLSGRDFNDSDRSGSAPVVIVSRAFVQRYFPNTDPLGKRIRMSTDPNDTTAWSTIIGTVGDVLQDGPTADVRPQVYLAHQQNPWPYMTLVVRSRAGVENLGAQIRREVAALDAQVPVDRIETIEQRITKSFSAPRFRTTLLVAFAALAALLAAIGIYGVVSFWVAQRTREFGIRIALGATRHDVVRLVLEQGIRPAALGVAIGLVAAGVLTRVLSSMLFGVSAHDPLVFAAVPLFLALVATIASYLPATRATRVDPITALRAD